MKTNRIPFSLEKYESGKYKVVTKNGRKARIICTDFKSKQPIIAIVEEENDKELFSDFALDGKWIGGRVSNTDLYLEETVFEDGDIVTNEKDIAIYKEIDKCYCGISEQDCLVIDSFFYYEVITRLATDEEKQRLFDALKKDGKRWNAEKKCIEKIKEECKFNPLGKEVEVFISITLSRNVAIGVNGEINEPNLKKEALKQIDIPGVDSDWCVDDFQVIEF